MIFKDQFTIFKRAAILFIFIMAMAAVPAARAATLNIVTSNPAPEINQPFRVDLQLDTQGDDANAIQGQIIFPADQFQIRNITDGSSPFSFWIEPPAETASGTISFSGIVPGGFDSAASSVVSVWFLPVTSGMATVSLSNIQLLRNDGEGTPIAVTTTSAIVAVSATVASTTAARPVSFTTPDPFTPVVSHDPNIFGGQYFLAFSTTDEGSGIAYYQVLEVPVGTGAQNLSSAWQTATSPYLLRDQTLSSNIYVRAVNHDGNFIVVEVPAEHSAGEVAARHANDALIIIFACLLLIILILALVLLR